MTSTHEDFQREHGAERSGNRSFGLVMAGAFSVVCLAPVISGRSPRLWAAPLAVGFLLASLTAPRLLEPLNRAWFALGLLLGKITSPIFLGVFYYSVLTPMALLMRATGKDFLSQRRDPARTSYWIPRTPPGPEAPSFRRQF